MTVPKLDPRSTIFFLCDIQTKFRPTNHGYDHVVATANKLVKLAKILNIELLATTQNTRALGPIDPAIDLESLGPLFLGSFDKSLFSMLVPDVLRILGDRPHVNSIVIFGMESHICVLQTALALLSFPNSRFTPHIIADGLSSGNAFEVPIAVDRMRQEGAIITTSESVAFQLMADASLPTFRTFARFIKDEKESTKRVGEALLQGKEEIANGHEPMVGIKSSY